MQNKVRVIVSDRDEIIREGLSSRLNQTGSISVIGEGKDLFQTLSTCAVQGPDVLVIDYCMFKDGNLQKMRGLKDFLPDLRTVILTENRLLEEVAKGIGFEMDGFVEKSAGVVEIATTIQMVSRGYFCFPESCRPALMKRMKPEVFGRNKFRLTPREIEVLKAWSTGSDARETGQRLNISARTVGTHRHSIYKKTSVKGKEGLRELADEYLS